MKASRVQLPATLTTERKNHMNATNKPTIETTCFLYMHAEMLRQIWLSAHEAARTGKNAFEVADLIRAEAAKADEAYRLALESFKS